MVSIESDGSIFAYSDYITSTVDDRTTTSCTNISFNLVELKSRVEQLEKELERLGGDCHYMVNLGLLDNEDVVTEEVKEDVHDIKSEGSFDDYLDAFTVKAGD